MESHSTCCISQNDKWIESITNNHGWTGISWWKDISLSDLMVKMTDWEGLNLWGSWMSHQLMCCVWMGEEWESLWEKMEQCDCWEGMMKYTREGIDGIKFGNCFPMWSRGDWEWIDIEIWSDDDGSELTFWSVECIDKFIE